MIAGVACVPQAPLLLPGVTGAAVPEVEAVRSAAAQAVRELLRHGADEVVVVGGAPATKTYPADAPSPDGRLAPASGRPPARDALPVSLAVGRSLLDQCPVPVVLQGVREDARTGECDQAGRPLAARPGRTGLLVAADGSARRGPKAPGYIDSRAAGLDARIAKALGAADTGTLLGLDPRLCEDLMVAGRAAWQTMAAACQATPWQARTLYTGDPFGVAYHVLIWLPPARS